MTTYLVTAPMELEVKDEDGQGVAHAVEKARLDFILKLAAEDIAFNVESA